jgi:hypothetical protein
LNGRSSSGEWITNTGQNLKLYVEDGLSGRNAQRRLFQGVPAGAWRPFPRNGWRSLIFPRPVGVLVAGAAAHLAIYRKITL